MASARTPIVAIDMMGGDLEPSTFVTGLEMVAVRFIRAKFIIFGDADLLRPMLEKSSLPKDRYELRHCETWVSMDDNALLALRRDRKTSSMGRAIGAVADGEAQAVVSAGNTGALFAIACNRLSAIPGIERPACASFWPTKNGECIVLDVGASTERSSAVLIQNAVMGAALARTLLDRPVPHVGLLNIGTELLKGPDYIREADGILRSMKHKGFNYKGFIEPNAVTSGTFDVVVCDGFTGNVMLKACEGITGFLTTSLRRVLTSTILNKAGAWIAGGAFRKMRELLDPRKRNGAILLGLNGLVVKSHGGADSVGLAAAIERACDLDDLDAMTKIQADLDYLIGLEKTSTLTSTGDVADKLVKSNSSNQTSADRKTVGDVVVESVGNGELEKAAVTVK